MDSLATASGTPHNCSEKCIRLYTILSLAPEVLSWQTLYSLSCPIEGCTWQRWMHAANCCIERQQQTPYSQAFVCRRTQ